MFLLKNGDIQIRIDNTALMKPVVNKNVSRQQWYHKTRKCFREQHFSFNLLKCTLLLFGKLDEKINLGISSKKAEDLNEGITRSYENDNNDDISLLRNDWVMKSHISLVQISSSLKTSDTLWANIRLSWLKICSNDNYYTMTLPIKSLQFTKTFDSTYPNVCIPNGFEKFYWVIFFSKSCSVKRWKWWNQIFIWI